MTEERYVLDGKLTLTQPPPKGGGEMGKRYLARFTKAGRVRAPGNAPAAVVLQAEAVRAAQAAGMFDGKAVFVDHAGWLENSSLKNLVGFTQASRWVEAEQAVEGELQLFDSAGAAEFARLLDQVLAEGKPDVGLSMVFYPVWQHNEQSGDRMISAIKHIESVDFVFEPATDSRLLAAFSSFNQASFNQTSFNQTSSNWKGAIMEEKISEWEGAVAQAAGSVIIAASNLPQASKDRLGKQQFGTPAEVEAAIAAERAYLAQLQEEHVIQIGGRPPRSSSLQVGRDGMERLSLALEALIAGTQPPTGVQPLSGIREFYHLISGDYEMSGVFQGERVGFANVNSSTMANMVANALNKVLMAEFQVYPQWWNPIVLEQDFSSLQAVKWITLGGVGELPTVAEGAAYTELAWDDKYEAGTFVKKGGYLGLTIEAIDKDDTGRLRAAPRALAQAAWLTLSKAVSAIFTTASGTGPTLTDSNVLFHSNHSNVGSTALSLTSWAATRLAMRKQTELNSSERLGGLTAPKYILVPPDLEVTALQVLASEGDYTYALSNAPQGPVNVFAEGNEREARLMNAAKRVIVVDLWTDTNDWAAVCDPRLYPTIGIGYRYGRSPEIFSVASPTAGLMFSNDTMPVKVRFFFAVGPIDYRGMYKHNVA